MKFNFFYQNCGHHDAAWRLAESDPMACLKADDAAKQAAMAEQLGFDAVFLADTPKVPAEIGRKPSFSLDSQVLASAIAAATKSCKIVATVSTSYTEPFNVARSLASLNWYSGGRMGWNVVTTHGDRAAKNFGRTRSEDHDLRYLRAREHVEICLALWRSWDIRFSEFVDQASGVWAPEGLSEPIGYSGDFYSCEGPLTLPGGPSGRPFIYQAGQSEAGMDLAAQYADFVFAAEDSGHDAARYIADLSERSAGYGRVRPGVMCGVALVLGATSRAAVERFEALTKLANFEGLLGQLERRLGVTPGTIRLEDALAAHVDVDSLATNGNRTWARNCFRWASSGASVGEYLQEFAFGRGAPVCVGDRYRAVEWLAEFAETAGCEGFNVMLPVLPFDLIDSAPSLEYIFEELL